MHPLDKWLFKFHSIGTETTLVVVVVVFLLLPLNRYLSLGIWYIQCFLLNIKRYLMSICRFALFSCKLNKNYCDTEWIYNVLSNSFIYLENIKFPIGVIANNSRIQTRFWIYIKWKRLRHWRHWHHSGFLKVHSQVWNDFWQLKAL